MRRELGAFKEKVIGWTLVSGLALAILSGILLWMFSMAGVFRGTYTRTPGSNQITDAGALNLAPLALTGIAIGVLMMIGALGYGFWSMSIERSGPRKTVTNFRVLARYCYDRNQQLITSDVDIDVADRPKFYVRGVLETGVVGEFETTIEVYYQAGEGMYGEAELQGKWLGRFVPYIGAQTNQSA